jgi:hypothetical protein
VTHSPYVGAYFAVEEADEENPFAVYAIQYLELHVRFDEHLSKQGYDSKTRDGFIRAAFDSDLIRSRGVVAGEPDRMNERMAAQQGLFLAQFDLGRSFEENLLAALGSNESEFNWASAPSPNGGTPIIKIVFEAGLRRETMKELKKMNISAATLYPGLDGFARSLTVEMKFG